MKQLIQERATKLLSVIFMVIVITLGVLTLSNPAHAQLDPIDVLDTDYVESNLCPYGQKITEYYLSYSKISNSNMVSDVNDKLAQDYILFGNIAIGNNLVVYQPMVKCGS